MATRMQQRRGTAAQWTAANPILAAGEIGFETDTNKFKMGNGTSAWASLAYFANATELAAAIDAVVGIAPETLDTLAEIAASLGDDPDFLSDLATNERVDGVVLQGAASLQSLSDSVSTSLTNHFNSTTTVHGIADTSLLVTQQQLSDAVAGAVVDQSALAGVGIDWNADNEQFDIDSTVATKSYADAAAAAITKEYLGLGAVDNVEDASKPVSTAQALAISTAKGEAITAAGQAADDKISAHNLDETNVHGIADTADLATMDYADNAVTTAVAALTKSSVGLANVDNTADADKPVSTATQSALDLKAPLADPTFTGTVSGITKSMVGLGNVENTADADKPVSTATQTALDAKASLAGATFTGDVTVETNLTIDGDLTVTGTTTTVNATDLVVTDPLIYIGEGNAGNLVDLGLVSSFNDGTYQHAGIVRDSSAGTWKLFKGVTDEPTTTVNFAQGSLDDLAVAGLTATTVTPSSGIVFSDGTQTKVGVPSITAFATAISSSATLASGEQDKFVPLTGAVTITLPATGYSTGQSIDFYQASGTGAQFASTNSVVGTPGLKFRTTNSVVTAMKTSSGWLVFGDLSA